MEDFQGQELMSPSQLDAVWRVINDQERIHTNIMEEQQQNLVEMLTFCSSLSATGFQPCSEGWAGPHNFRMSVSSEAAGKTSCVYSSQLDKVFLPMNASLPVQFKCVWAEPDLCVRALPVFLEADELHKPVRRCSHHVRDKEETNMDFEFPAHVVRCESMDSVYTEDPSSKRLSVVTPLGTPPPGSDVVVLHYRFMCKTSCLGGMNRRPIHVVFTLERHTGEVVGRAAVKVRICSCPKRDMRKEEEVAARSEQSPSALPGGEAAADPATRPPKAKKIKLEPAKRVRFIPIFGDEDFFKECARLLRTHFIGGKLVECQQLTAEEKQNLDTFNSIIDSGQANIKEEIHSELAE
ncbi:cellular tumor antigen p53-like [Bacillus rossius redtenbacheri]|uniref:cellular tumor antigen p53-like n=1 Tax=Bacillus rossius redtenbacheri TaxID=93214 RepID=UPI002FDE1463